MDQKEYDLEYDYRIKLKEELINNNAEPEKIRNLLIKKLHYSFSMATKLINKWCYDNKLEVPFSEAKRLNL